MSASIPEFPTRPHGPVHTVPLAELLDAYSGHMRVLVVARPQDDDESADATFRHAVAALALLHTITDRLFQARWATVRDALAADVARAEEVAVACGLEGTEVAAGLRSWAADQVEHGLMAEWEYGITDLMARSIGGEQ
jgi:hypothetical protein